MGYWRDGLTFNVVPTDVVGQDNKMRFFTFEAVFITQNNCHIFWKMYVMNGAMYPWTCNSLWSTFPNSSIIVGFLHNGYINNEVIRIQWVFDSRLMFTFANIYSTLILYIIERNDSVMGKQTRWTNILALSLFLWKKKRFWIQKKCFISGYLGSPCWQVDMHTFA